MINCKPHLFHFNQTKFYLSVETYITYMFSNKILFRGRKYNFFFILVANAVGTY